MDKAGKLYQELVADLQENPEFLEEFVYLLRELGRLEEAKVEAGKYLSLVPDDTAMADLYESL